MIYSEACAHPHTLVDDVDWSWLAQLPDGAFHFPYGDRRSLDSAGEAR